MDITWITPLIAGILRNFMGWLQSSQEDGKITKYEVAQLGKTIVEISILSAAVFYGLGSDLIQSAAIAVLASYGISAVKKVGK